MRYRILMNGYDKDGYRTKMCAWFENHDEAFFYYAEIVEHIDPNAELWGYIRERNEWYELSEGSEDEDVIS
jgi:hypothetical protein